MPFFIASPKDKLTIALTCTVQASRVKVPIGLRLGVAVIDQGQRLVTVVWPRESATRHPGSVMHTVGMRVDMIATRACIPDHSSIEAIVVLRVRRGIALETIDPSDLNRAVLASEQLQSNPL